MAEAFLPNPNNLPCVNHKDENPMNNYIHINPDGSVNPELSNLEWCSYEYNSNYGTSIQRTREKKFKPIFQYTLTGEFVNEWDSCYTAAKVLGINGQSLRACCRGERKTSHGYIWKYKTLPS